MVELGRYCEIRQGSHGRRVEVHMVEKGEVITYLWIGNVIAKLYRVRIMEKVVQLYMV